MNPQEQTTSKHIEPEVRQVIDAYRQFKALHPTVAQVCCDPGLNRVFFGCLQNDLHVINARSQDLNDHEITKHQKAFSTLMHNQADRFPGIYLYTEELLGLKVLCRLREETLKQEIKIREVLAESKPYPELLPASNNH